MLNGVWTGRVGRPSGRRRMLLALEDHANVVGRAGLEVDRGDADQLPPLIAQAVQLFRAPGIHRVVLGPDIDDLVLPGLHDRPLPRCSAWVPTEVDQPNR